MRLILDALQIRQGGFSLGPLSLALGPGLHRLTGPNGAGKTTLLRAIAGDLSPTTGRALLDTGAAPRDLHRDDQARRAIGLCPSAPELPDFLSAAEAVAMLGALRAGGSFDPAPSLARMGALRLPPATPLHTCSAGMRHKAELLAALAGEPRLLLLDEPFANLDVEAVATVAAWLDGWRDRIILISHHGALPVEADGELALG